MYMFLENLTLVRCISVMTLNKFCCCVFSTPLACASSSKYPVFASVDRTLSVGVVHTGAKGKYNYTFNNYELA